MKKFNRLLSILVILLGFVSLTGSGWAQTNLTFPLMQPEAWYAFMSNFPPVIEGPAKAEALQEPVPVPNAAMDLLSQIPWSAANMGQRDQVNCGNCWVWASTGCLEVEHSVVNAVLDRLSIQYFDSCCGCGTVTGHLNDPCCGGDAFRVASYYAGAGLAVPWGNAGAAFADGTRGCGDAFIQPCANITTTPFYPITSIAARTIATHNVGQATAIANIKNILNQNKAVYFSFALPNAATWNNFFNFWGGVGGETEATLWEDIDAFCGTEWDERAGQAGGHAIVLLGYNDTDANPTNHYWLLMNSWGRAGGVRPNGLLRIPMQMNYDCSYPNNGTPGYWANGFVYFDVVFGAPPNNPPTANAGGPYVAECAGSLTRVQLNGTASSDPDPGDKLTYAWTSDCPGATLDNPGSATPVLTVNSSPGCLVNCHVTLTVTDSAGATNSATANVTVHDTTPPTVICPTNMVLEFADENGAVANFVVGASDVCSSLILTISPASGSVFPIGTTTVTATATDFCGNTNSCSFTVEVLGARGVKQHVLDELVALHVPMRHGADAYKLELAIEFLTASLDPALWVDQTHVAAVNGGMVFQREKQTVEKLQQVIKSKRSEILKATLQNFIDRLLRSDRLLAVVAINEAIAAGGNPMGIALAQKELARGDAYAAAGRLSDAIEGYRIAWMHALLTERRAGAQPRSVDES
jgi:hypothetical protein